ncbi:MAG TPA: Nif3-like dinuclear metal center hexameric protein [Rhodocyclaceae bacterium]|nr:Nif3-like dinuclear metal center hexameric protein [Rhodocyclaceae bacterium]
MQREELRTYLDATLEATRFRDYCPNGLQVEGKSEINRILCATTASQAVIDAAIAEQADAILVHHGWFWKNEDGRVTGFRKQRMAALLKHDINLFAYHLPLDAHPALGNNVQLAERFGWAVTGNFGEQGIGFLGTPSVPTTAAELSAHIGKVLGRQPQLLGNGAQSISHIAWCSGGAQGYFEQAIAAGADVFISGEVSEQTYHLALETGVPYIAAGHHATERYGIQALGQHLSSVHGLDYSYLELDNPV